MDKNEIKKELYKNKPTAYRFLKTDDLHIYQTLISNSRLQFNVPLSDMGTSIHRFKDEMPAHELIRWLINE